MNGIGNGSVHMLKGILSARGVNVLSSADQITIAKSYNVFRKIIILVQIIVSAKR